MERFKFFTEKVKAKIGESRENEVITRTDWYTDNAPTCSPDQPTPKARLVEKLRKLTGMLYQNTEGKTTYEPRIFLEVSGRASDLEKPHTTFTRITDCNGWFTNTSVLNRFPGAVAEFIAFRGYINDDGVKGSRETKYFKEIGIRKGEINDRIEKSPVKK
jgi:hypothetical protein